MIKIKLACTALFLSGAISAFAIDYGPGNVASEISLKTPGNKAVSHNLTLTKITGTESDYSLVSSDDIPVILTQKVTKNGDVVKVDMTITATENVYFNFGEQVKVGYRHDDCQFYMPGFWYRRNLRSPKEAPSFHTSDSWLVREDRLSTPLTAAYNEKMKKTASVIRVLDGVEGSDALTQLKAGEVILSGCTTLGYTGFENKNGNTVLSFGFPYKEAPKTYIRKLTLAPEVEAYQFLAKGQSVSLSWQLRETEDADFSSCVQNLWEYSYDMNRPQPVTTPYTTDIMKSTMSNYFVESFVKTNSVNYFSSPEMPVSDCRNCSLAEIGFVGRTLLNAYNALEYGYQNNRSDLVEIANAIFDSYLKNGISEKGFLREVIRTTTGEDANPIRTIRRQSEGVYALLYYLDFEKRNGRKHAEWEKNIRNILDMFLRLQNQDGSFPRKFKDDFTIVDKSGGSTPSATVPLVMGYKYFKDKRYLAAAKRSVDYLEKELISKADYFSSTLDANCEDKEASLYASTAAYYLALATKGVEREHYASLVKKASYFALSWYYTWDVPFARGQMLGDMGMKTRGWGNVSVENNHIDVYVFDFADVLNWLAKEYSEPRFSKFSEVINSSMRQLLPLEGHMCGLAKVGYYPEVVQHANWDYGKNGKGFYNDIFAPGWTVASLWELLTPGRAESFFAK